MMKLFLTIIFLTMLSTVGFTQSETAQLPKTHLKGNVKSILSQRTYIVLRGKYVGEVVEKTEFEEYDRNGELTRSIEYGNVERQSTYTRDADKLTVEVKYYDTAGNPLVKGPETFKPNSNTPTDESLCAKFTLTTRKDLVGKIENIDEICSDGSKRASETTEYDGRGEVIRWYRSDAKSRNWEYIASFDKDGNVSDFRYLVNDKKQPPYVQTQNVVDYRFDERGNWTRATITSFNSNVPGQLMFQYLEQQVITYFTD